MAQSPEPYSCFSPFDTGADSPVFIASLFPPTTGFFSPRRRRPIALTILKNQRKLRPDMAMSNPTKTTLNGGDGSESARADASVEHEAG